MFIIDASVALRWHLPGSSREDNAYASMILERLETQDAIAPQLFSIEVMHVLGRYALAGALSAEDANRGLLQLLDSVTLISLEKAKVTDILGYSIDYNLTGYDASYLQLAVERQLPMATLDKKLRKACQKAGVKVFSGD